ncbi:MAG TPA: antitoxin Xre-like helix-turn-helix domain-containing protein [Terriglobales bacterium]|jgi:putative toxin-antitoxin system antitoxin component (TIGR02293 family)|nr:antitoxin Xre-like helix-turn-helix domain-containing protein [Terriglobales bacterium]
MAIAAEKSSRTQLPGRALGLEVETLPELIRRVDRGFGYRALESMAARSGIVVAELASTVGIPQRTLARRKVSGRLTPEESERLLRISMVFESALELFEGDRAAAVKWLHTPRPVFDGQTPMAYSRTELGAREVDNLIGRLERGVFS